jgi:hypothetical protein
MSAAATTALRDEIRSALQDVGLTKVDPSILAKCTLIFAVKPSRAMRSNANLSTHSPTCSVIFTIGTGLASTLQVSPKQIAECWEAFSLNKNLTTLNDHCFAGYQLALSKDSDKSSFALDTGAVVSRPTLGKRQSRSPNNTDGESLPSVTPPSKRFNVTFDDSTFSAVDAVASNRRVSLSPAPPGILSQTPISTLPKYGERKEAGKVVVTFNPNKLEATESSSVTPVSSSPKCTVSTDFVTNVQEAYRHMFTPLEERAKALDQHLVDLGEIMVERYGLGKQDEDNETGIAGLEAVGVPRQDKVCCIGRVCNAVCESRNK